MSKEQRCARSVPGLSLLQAADRALTSCHLTADLLVGDVAITQGRHYWACSVEPGSYLVKASSVKKKNILTVFFLYHFFPHFLSLALFYRLEWAWSPNFRSGFICLKIWLVQGKNKISKMNKGKGQKRMAEMRRGSRFVNVKIWHLILPILLLLCSKLLQLLFETIQIKMKNRS